LIKISESARVNIQLTGGCSSDILIKGSEILKIEGPENGPASPADGSKSFGDFYESIEIFIGKSI
jgi:hypothetical protein